MILAGLPSALVWRLAKELRPFVNDWLQYWAWCSPRFGMIGTHTREHHGRCTTCKRRVR